MLCSGRERQWWDYQTYKNTPKWPFLVQNFDFQVSLDWALLERFIVLYPHILLSNTNNEDTIHLGWSSFCLILHLMTAIPFFISIWLSFLKLGVFSLSSLLSILLPYFANLSGPVIHSSTCSCLLPFLYWGPLSKLFACFSYDMMCTILCV